MTAFLRTRRFRGGVRHDFNLRDVKEEVVKMGKNQQKPNHAGDLRPISMRPKFSFLLFFAQEFFDNPYREIVII